MRKFLGKIRLFINQWLSSLHPKRIRSVSVDETSILQRVRTEWQNSTQSGYDAQSEVGFHTYIGPLCQITKAKIGNYCSIAPRVLIGLGEHNPYSISTSTLFCKEDVYDTLTKDPVIIGHDVWIGCNAVILRGVRVGNGAIIGASAVVTRDVPAFGIAVGNPARVIKYRFDSDTISKIEQSQWWLEDLEIAKMMVEELGWQLSSK